MTLEEKEMGMAQLLRAVVITTLTVVKADSDVIYNDHADEHSFSVRHEGDEYEIAVRIRTPD